MANIIGGSIGAGKAILNDYTLGVEDIDGGHRLTITRGSEVQAMDIMDGKNGNDGNDGAPGAVQTVNGEAPDESGNVQVSGLPEGAGANMQLVTDADGTAKWEEKPFYSTQKEITVTWDGDTTDREVTDLGSLGFFKVSDSIIPRDNVIGGIFTLTTESGSEDHVITEDMCFDLSANIPGAWYVVYDNFSMLGSGPAFEDFGSSGGLYYVKSENLYVSSLYFIDESINTIEQKYLPEIPAAKLPEIPAEKLPDVFDTKDLVVELDNFYFDTLTQSTQPMFSFKNVTYAELLDAAKKSKVILKNSGKDFYINHNIISCDSNGNISIIIMFGFGSGINVIGLMCNANKSYFYRNSWYKVATETN